MEKSNRTLTMLLSLILIVIPLVAFHTFRVKPLVGGSVIYLFFEMVYYGTVFWIMRRDASLAVVFTGTIMAIIYRMSLGLFFGLILLGMFTFTDLTTPLSWGLIGYMPAVLLHIAATPFVVRQYYLRVAARLMEDDEEFEMSPPTFANEVQPQVSQTFASVPKPIQSSSPGIPNEFAARIENHSSVGATTDRVNNFDKALTYLSESTSVKMALLVDEEGLTLAQFNRCEEDPELWAPLAVIVEGNNRNLLGRFYPVSELEKIEIGTMKMRIILRRIGHLTLMILAEKSIDETVHIRINQAAEMVRKYMSERYSPDTFARVEERYV